MTLLALECSTAEHSAAVLDGSRCLAQTAWAAGPAGNAQLFCAIAAVLTQSGVAASGLDAFAVGIGPGSFTGIRSAAAAARAMALPGAKPVVGVCSADAMACQVLMEFGDSGAPSVEVVGDARRGMGWIASYRAEGHWPVRESQIRLVSLPALADEFRRGALVASPDAGRMRDALQDAARHAMVRFLPGAPAPTAGTLGALALRLLDGGAMLPPAIPLYLHAAVAR